MKITKETADMLEITKSGKIFLIMGIVFGVVSIPIYLSGEMIIASIFLGVGIIITLFSGNTVFTITKETFTKKTRFSTLTLNSKDIVKFIKRRERRTQQTNQGTQIHDVLTLFVLVRENNVQRREALGAISESTRSVSAFSFINSMRKNFNDHIAIQKMAEFLQVPVEEEDFNPLSAMTNVMFGRNSGPSVR